MDTNDFKTGVGPEGEELKTSIQGHIEDLQKPVSKSVAERLKAMGTPAEMHENVDGEDLNK